MKIISSRDNALFKTVHKLARSARERRKVNATVLDGVHLVSAYLAKGGRPDAVVVAASSSHHGEIRALLEKAAPLEAAVMSDALFRLAAPVETPSGILAVIGLPVVRRFPPDAAFCVFLEDLQDPGNLGSILRSAAAAGARHVLLSPHCADAWSPKTLRAAMGAHFLLEIHENADLPAAARSYRGKVVAAVLRAGKPLYRLDLTGPTALLIGNEGAGLSDGLAGAAHECVAIPMPGGMESLNAAAAAAVCLFEKVRQDAV